MKVASIQLRQFRSFVDSGLIEFDTINVLIGPNNSGKSSLLRGLHLLQSGLGAVHGDVRVGSNQAVIEIVVSDLSSPLPWTNRFDPGPITLRYHLASSDRRSGSLSMDWRKPATDWQQVNTHQFADTEPHHYIVPFLSKRKTAAFAEDTREQHVLNISSDMTNLAAKLSRLANPSFPAYAKYAEACEAILGFVVTAIPSVNGQKPGVYLPDGSTVPIEQMGEGVPNIVYLLAQLAVSEKRLFLIEEPENDLHPSALKALLDLILVSAQSNQFVISTHSNIVVTHLCGREHSRLFKVTSEKGQLPTEARIEPVPPTAESRVEVLQELGYAFSDYDLWEGWLLLEESSAERIIRDYLIPWFAPKLSRLKTVAAGGVTNVEPAFRDLHRLMLFTHLQPAYEGRAWVRVDGDEQGEATIAKLQGVFPSIAPEHFGTFRHPQFEFYYPTAFHEEVKDALSITGKQARREAKRKLLSEVVSWLDANQEQAREELEQSAAELIDDLRDIERQLTKSNGV